MATDPIQRVREIEHESVLDLDAHHALTRLAALGPSTEAPYLTIYLDWRPEGADPGRGPAPPPRPSERRANREESVSRRPARQRLERDLAELVDGYGPRGSAFESIGADAERIGAYLDAELDPAAQGVVIVACSAVGVFEPLALGLPVPTRLAVGPTPALFHLALLLDDHPTYAVLLADQHEANLTLIDQATPNQGVFLESSDYPRKQQQGGWSQRRFQARAGERVAAFARGIAEETHRALAEGGVGMLVVAGDEVITSALDAVFHPTVKELIVGRLRLDNQASDQEIVAATLPLAAQAERDREAEAVEALRDAVGAGAGGAAGAEATLAALQAGQVATLVVVDDFAGSGWADFSFPLFGVGPVPGEHPAGGDPVALVPIALQEEMVCLAASGGAEVQIVHTALPVAAGPDSIPEPGSPPPRAEPAARLDELGGVGALLRYSLDGDQPTAER